MVWKRTLKRDWARDEKNEYRRRQINLKNQLRRRDAGLHL